MTMPLSAPQGERSLAIVQCSSRPRCQASARELSSEGCACAILFDTIELVCTGTSPVFPKALVKQSHRTWRCFFWVSRWSNHYTGSEWPPRGLGGDSPCLCWRTIGQLSRWQEHGNKTWQEHGKKTVRALQHVIVVVRARLLP
jgi:hypothetical protein